METNNSLETLEALIDPRTREVKYLTYQVEGVGEFRREGGKWVVNLEETPEQFDDLDVVDLDISNAMPLIEQWDTGDGVLEEDVRKYELPEEEEV